MGAFQALGGIWSPCPHLSICFLTPGFSSDVAQGVPKEALPLHWTLSSFILSAGSTCPAAPGQFIFASFTGRALLKDYND